MQITQLVKNKTSRKLKNSFACSRTQKYSKMRNNTAKFEVTNKLRKRKGNIVFGHKLFCFQLGKTYSQDDPNSVKIRPVPKILYLPCIIKHCIGRGPVILHLHYHSTAYSCQRGLRGTDYSTNQRVHWLYTQPIALVFWFKACKSNAQDNNVKI